MEETASSTAPAFVDEPALLLLTTKKPHGAPRTHRAVRSSERTASMCSSTSRAALLYWARMFCPYVRGCVRECVVCVCMFFFLVCVCVCVCARARLELGEQAAEHAGGEEHEHRDQHLRAVFRFTDLK